MSDSLAYPRPEYPRPDFQRGTIDGIDWLNLNGPWQFRFDGDRRGVDEKWFTPERGVWREQIIVPFCWESLAAWGEGDSAGNENYYSTRVFRNSLEVNRSNHCYVPRYEVGWYRRWVKVPEGEAWQNKRIILKVGAADFFTDCWCNGIHVGRHEGGYTPFEWDITDSLVRAGDGSREAFIVFRVEDPMDNREQPVGKQWHWYTPTSGIWQTVLLEPRHEVYIDSFRIIPDIDHGTATFEIEGRHVDEDCWVEAEIFPPHGKTFRITLSRFESGLARNIMMVNPLLLWNPNEPFLYKVLLRLMKGETILDQVRTYFGMRKIDSCPAEDPKAPAVLRLNNVPRYLRGALYQSYYPEGVYTAGSVETLKKDILAAKRFGFNFLRVHIKIDDPLLLYYADTLGMLLMADFPNFGEGGDTPAGRRRFEEMMRAAITRDFNHPSIFAWCVFNETWGFGGQVELLKAFPQVKGKKIIKKFDAATASPTSSIWTNPAGLELQQEKGGETASGERKRLANISAHAWVQTMWQLAKKLDPTRLVEDMSVVHWEHLDYFAHGDTDINSWHFYINDYEQAKAHIEKVVESTYPGSSYNYVPGFEHRGQPLINSEYGGVGALDGDRDMSWSFKFLTNELRRHGAISAYIFTELNDVEWEYNGFLNYDRTPKHFGYDPRIINESDVIPVDAPPVSRRRPGEELVVEVLSSHYSTIKHENVSLRWRLGGMDSCGRIHQDIVAGVTPIAFPHRRVALAHRIKLKMPEITMLCTLSIEAIAHDGEVVASNFIQFFVAEGDLPERECLDQTVILRAKVDRWTKAEWSGEFSTRETALANGYSHAFGHGCFEWELPLGDINFSEVRRLRVLCEASSHRVDTPQTDDDHYPTTLEIQVNDVPIYHEIIMNHPHDSRGALSYLRKARGAYGYLAYAATEGELLRQIIEKTRSNTLRLKCLIPSDALAIGGLTIYGPECGRYPVCPTILLEWR